LDPLPNLDSAIAIRDTVARLISDVYEGKLHPGDCCRFGTAHPPAAAGRPITALEQRLAKLERLVRDAFLKDGRGMPVIKEQEEV
jgi:hypothetical protein